jgi:glycosyltransferase involved in cell wall biosynthesis
LAKSEVSVLVELARAKKLSDNVLSTLALKKLLSQNRRQLPVSEIGSGKMSFRYRPLWEGFDLSTPAFRISVGMSTGPLSRSSLFGQLWRAFLLARCDTLSGGAREQGRVAMRLLIDGTPLLLRSGGVKNYLYYWLLHLKKLAGPSSIRIFPFLNELGELHHERSTLGLFSTFVRLLFLHFANVRGNPVLNLVGRRIDLFHASSTQVWNVPTNTRFSATLYDMTCWLFPETHLPANVRATREFAETVAQRADGFIAISESTRDDAVRLLGLRREKIRVIYPGVAEDFFLATPETAAEVRRRYGLARPYVLFVGIVEPRKNLDVLLEAYSGLPASVRGDFELVIAGAMGWASPIMVSRLCAPPGGVRYLGYVPEADLPGLTAGAELFAYPSLYEGFGLPVAQAMAAGVAVVTSNISSLPEIAGDAAMLVDPRSVAEVRAALVSALQSPELRARLGNNGRRRVQQYRWELCAAQSLDFFRELTGL